MGHQLPSETPTLSMAALQSMQMAQQDDEDAQDCAYDRVEEMIDLIGERRTANVLQMVLELIQDVEHDLSPAVHATPLNVTDYLRRLLEATWSASPYAAAPINPDYHLQCTGFTVPQHRGASVIVCNHSDEPGRLEPMDQEGRLRNPYEEQN